MDSQSDVGDWPDPISTAPPTDPDHDGMADEWETSRRLNPTHPSDEALITEVYTNLELCLNSLILRGD